MANAAGQPVILQVVPELGPGGAETACFDVAAGLTAAGAQALVASHGGMRLKDLPRTGATHIELPVDAKNPFAMAMNVRRLRAVIRRHKVDIVHARSRAPAWSCLEACRGTKARFMTTCHAPFNIGGAPKRFYNSSIARGERIIAISHYVERYLEDNYKTDPAIIRVVPRGIDLGKFSPGAVTVHRMMALSAAWRVPDGSHIVLLPARLTRWKGHETLIEAMARLKRPDAFCVMLGASQGREAYRAELEALIAARGLEGRIRLVDHCADMPAAYMLADAVVSASTEPEGFGRVAVEAQAMGRLCIATDHGGSRETIRRGETGWLVPPGDAGALGQAVAEALAMAPAEAAAIGWHAMQHVARNFSRDSMVAATLRVYDELLARPYFAVRIAGNGA